MVKYANIERTIAVFRDNNGDEFKRIYVNDRMGKFPKNASEYSLYKFFADESMIEVKVRIGSLISEVNENNCFNDNLLKAAHAISSLPKKEDEGEYIYYKNGDVIMISQVSENTKLVPNFRALEASFINDVIRLESLNCIDDTVDRTKKI